jgi:hypothetical protein
VANLASGEIGPTQSNSQLGSVAGNYLENVGARAVGDIVNREVSVALGDRHVPSWAQVGEDVAGSALANGALLGIRSYQQQQAQTAINTKVLNSVSNDIGTLNNTIWNGVSSDLQTSLSNEGQAALDQAWGQMPFNGNENIPSSISGAGSANGNDSESTSFASSGAAPTSAAGSFGVAYSSMPLNGHGGAQVDYFMTPEDSLMGAVGSGNEGVAGSSDRLTIATGNNAAKDAVYSFVAQVVANGGPSIDPATASASDWASYVHDYSILGEENPAAQSLSPINVNANVQSSVILGDQSDYTPDQSLIAQDTAPSTAIDFSRIPPLPNQPWTNQQSNTQRTGDSIPSIPNNLAPITENFKAPPLQVEPLTLPPVDVGSIQTVPVPPPSAPPIPANFPNFNLGVRTSPILPLAPSFGDVVRQHQLETQPGFRPVETSLSQRIYEHISQGNGLERFMGGVQSSVGQVITGFMHGEDQYGNTHNVLTGQPILAADAKANHIASIGGLLIPGEEGFAALEKAVAGGMRGILRTASKDALLSSRTGQLTGVAKFDQLFSQSAPAQKMISALERRGVIVVNDASRLDPGASAQLIRENGKLTLIYDSNSTSFVDMLHESRHVAQVQRAEAADVLGEKDIFGSPRLLGVAERGAYEYELRLGNNYGFSSDYMKYVRSQIDFYYPSSYSAKFNTSPTMRRIFNAMEPGLNP